MSKKVLFTFAGGHDPIGKENDGPILHICRHNHPEKIYLILTKEMKKIHESENVYEKAIHANLNYKPTIIPVKTDIEDAHHFDAFFDIINEVFGMIIQHDSDAQILVNISSGTPQMTSNLITYIINSTELDLVPIQVSTPENKSNYHNEEKYKNYDAVEAAKKNKDNNTNPEPPKRIEYPDLTRYMRIKVRNQIINLLSKYEYEMSLKLLNLTTFEKSNEIKTILNYANERKHLKGIRANEILTKHQLTLPKELLYFPQDPTVNDIPLWYRVVDYFTLAMAKQKSLDIAGYILMLEPLAVNLYLSILKDLEISSTSFFNLFTNIVSDKKAEPRYKLDGNKVSKNCPDLATKINKKFKNDYDYHRDISLKLLSIVIGHALEKDAKLSSKFDKKDLAALDNIFLIESKKNSSGAIKTVKDVRNLLAHSLTTYNQTDFQKTVQRDIESINNALTNFLSKYYTKIGYSEQMLHFYDNINKEILKLLEEENCDSTGHSQ